MSPLAICRGQHSIAVCGRRCSSSLQGFDGSGLVAVVRSRRVWLLCTAEGDRGADGIAVRTKDDSTAQLSQTEDFAPPRQNENAHLSSEPSRTPKLTSDESHGRAPEGGDESDYGWQKAFPHALTASVANFCFGYHIGIFNGPLDSVAAELGFAGDTVVEGFVVSIFLAGAFLGSAGGGYLADLVGRRRNFQLDTIPLIGGAIVSATATSLLQMEAGRFLVGVGVGAAAGFVALYISEVAPTKYRGALSCLCQVGTCLGIITSLLVGIPATSDPHWWRTMFWISNIPAVVLAVGMQFSAESPRWLTKVGRWDEAETTISHLWGPSNVDEALRELREVEEQEKGQEEASWAELMSPQYIKVALIGGSLYALQQFAGINGVLYFSSSTFRDAGISNEMLASAAVGVANLAGALTVLSLMDAQGRKPLLILSYGGMAVAMAVMTGALVLPLPADVSHALSIGGTLGYCFLFALGAGPVTAVIIPELCSTRIRAKTLAFSLCVHWVCNFAIGQLFLDFVRKFGVPAIYTGFGAVSLLAVAFSEWALFETKGRSLEEIEAALLIRKKNE